MYLCYIKVAEFIQKISNFENLEKRNTTIVVKEVSYFDKNSIYVLIETGLLFILVFLLGFINFSRQPRLKTSICTFLFLLGFIGFEVYTYMNGVKNITMIVCLAGLVLTVIYTIFAGLKKAQLVTYFKDAKDNIYYEYTYQRLFQKPSIKWMKRLNLPLSERKKIDFQEFEKLNFIKKILFTMTPFKLNLKKKELHFPVYIPLKYMINLTITTLIFAIIMFNLTKTYSLLKSATMIVVDALMGTDENEVPEIKEVQRAFLISWNITVVLFVIVFLLILWRSSIRFIGDIINLRKGFYFFDDSRHDSYNSLNYIPAYIGNAIFSYQFFLTIIFIIFLPLSMPFIYRLAWHYRSYWFWNVLFILINIIADVSLNFVFTDLTHYRFRRAYQIYDIFRMFTGFVASAGSGIARYFLIFIVLSISLFRIDKQSIPRWVSQFFNFNLDLVNLKHNSFLKCYHSHNNPILHSFLIIIQTYWMNKKNTKSQNKNADDDIEAQHFSKSSNDKINKKIAYKWQLMVLLVKNPTLMKYRKFDKIDEEVVENNMIMIDELNGEVHDDNLIGKTGNNNINQLFGKNNAQRRNFYDKTGPARMMNEDDDNFAIELKRKLKPKKKADIKGLMTENILKQKSNIKKEQEEKKKLKEKKKSSKSKSPSKKSSKSKSPSKKSSKSKSPTKKATKSNKFNFL